MLRPLVHQVDLLGSRPLKLDTDPKVVYDGDESCDSCGTLICDRLTRERLLRGLMGFGGARHLNARERQLLALKAQLVMLQEERKHYSGKREA